MRVVNDTALTAGWLVGRVPPHPLCATCVVKGTYGLVQDGVAQPLEPRVPLAGDVPADEHPLSLRYSGDLVPVKPFVDLMLWAKGYAPGGKPVRAFAVEFSVGRWTKRLVLLGERRKVGGLPTPVITEPVPFAELPVCYDMAFGGPSDPINPAGRGAEEVRDAPGGAYTPLPRVLHPDDPADDGPSSKNRPAGFGAIAPAWAGRMRKARRATFDDVWLKTEWPGYPRDFDWSYFNAAPEDQQLPAGALAGNEEIRLRNLHKSHADFACRLSGARPRWFTLGTDGGFNEVPLLLDTLQVDAEAGTLALVWRGIAPLKSRRMNDIAAKLIVQEQLADAALSARHYHALLLRRLKEIDDARKPNPPPAFEIAPLVIEPPGFDVKQFEEELNAEIAAAREEAFAPDPESMAQFAKTMADPWVQGAGLRPQHFNLAGPAPPASPEAVAGSLAESHERLAAAHPPAAPLLGPAPAAADLEIPAWATANMAELDALNRGDHDGKEDEGAEEEDEGWTRERVQAHAAARGSFAEQDLTELDLSDLDLSRLDFTEAMFEGSSLSHVNFAQATLTRATLVACDLSGADLSGAVLDDADLSQTKAAGVSFHGATLRNTTAIEADWSGADLQRAEAMRVNLTGARLAKIRARESDFSEALLDDAVLTEADFSGCILRETFATAVNAAGANFDGSDLTNFRGCNAADFSGASFQRIRASSAVFNASRLDKANFYEALLDEANFEEASLREAVFSRARMRKAKLADADLTLAKVLQADLFRATFEGANLTAADLRGANLFEAEFLNADITDTRREFANLRRTKLA